MDQPCWRVAVRVYRQDVLGRTHVVERHGPIIEAASAPEAIERARGIFEGSLDFASVGDATYLHTGHRGVVASWIERRPIASPDLSLEDSLARMAFHVRRRRGH